MKTESSGMDIRPYTPPLYGKDQASFAVSVIQELQPPVDAIELPGHLSWNGSV